MPPKGWKKPRITRESDEPEAAEPQQDPEPDLSNDAAEMLNLLMAIPDEVFTSMINKSGLGHYQARGLVAAFRRLKG